MVTVKNNSNLFILIIFELHKNSNIYPLYLIFGIKTKTKMSNQFDFQIPGSIPVNSTLQDLEENDDNDSFDFNEEELVARKGATSSSIASRRSRNSRKLSSNSKQENFIYENQLNEMENVHVENNFYYDNDIEATDLKEITSITRINQSNKVILNSFREKYPTSIRLPSERALSSSSSFNSLTDQFENQEYYDDQLGHEVEDGYDDEKFDNNCLDVLERKMSRNLCMSNQRESSNVKSLSKSDLNRIYKELNEIHNRLVVNFFANTFPKIFP